MRKIRLPKKIRMALWIIGLVTLVISSVFYSQPPEKVPEKKDDTLGKTTIIATSSAFVRRVIDGDTIEVLINEEKFKVRLIGIDTPESVDPRRPVECLGKEASNRLKELINQKQIVMEGDPSQAERDKYNRLLRYVYLDGKLINQQLITEGFAIEYTYDLPYRYQQEFRGAQKVAQEQNLGLWDPNTCVQS